jgi:hypothetical protein
MLQHPADESVVQEWQARRKLTKRLVRRLKHKQRKKRAASTWPMLRA